jgi:homoserine kinase
VRPLGSSVSVRVPATSANLGPGFDALGLALGWYDDLTATLVPDDALDISVDGVGLGVVPLDERHLVVRAMVDTFAELDLPRPGLSLRCVNRIPHGRGLGSSAAAVVAGVLLARALVVDGARRLPDAVVLGIAAHIEGHPDNVAAALLGGLTVAWYDGHTARAARIDPAAHLVATVLVPDTTLATARARTLLPPTVPHRDAAHSAGRAALLVHAVARDPALLLPATEDRLHQAYRSSAMPDTLDTVARLRAAGYAAVVSGAGPSVLLLSGDAPALDDVRRTAGAGWDVRPLAVDRVGARVTSERVSAVSE